LSLFRLVDPPNAFRVGINSKTRSMGKMVIDYAALATTLATGLGVAVTAAIGVGASILIAKMGWRFFKSFAK